MAVHANSVEFALRKRIGDLERERDALRIVITNAQDVLSAFSVENPATELSRESLRYRIIHTMERVLREEGRPMHREDIKAAVESRGVPVRSIQTIANYLSKAGGFVNKGNGFWDLHEMNRPGPS